MKKLNLILILFILIISCKKKETKLPDPEPIPVVTIPQATLTIACKMCTLNTQPAEKGSVLRIYKTNADIYSVNPMLSYTTGVDGILTNIIVPIQTDFYWILLTGASCNTSVKTTSISVKVEEQSYSYILNLK